MVTGAFKDPTNLIRWTVRFQYALIVISVIAVGSGLLEHRRFTDLKSGVYTSEGAAMAAAEAYDASQIIVDGLQFLILAVSGVFGLMWIYRASFNVRQLGAANLRFSPRWCVGWYFIPIANLWKPYQAMKEIWQASVNPSAWKHERASALLPWWWFLWIFYESASSGSARYLIRADEIDELLTANMASLASDIIKIPLCLIFLSIVKRVYSMQMSHAVKVV